MINKNKLIIILVFLFSCSTTKKNINIYPRYSLIKTQNEEIKDIKIESNFIKGTKEYLEFMIYINNNTVDTVKVNPSTFYYEIENKDSLNINYFKNQVFCIDPDTTLEKLLVRKDSLSKLKNPYSLTTKKTKGIITDALISGTIGTILGVKPEDLEKQRKYDEDDWDEKQNNKIIEANKQITFWNKDALKHHMILSHCKDSGAILFPISINNEIEVFLPINDKIYSYKYKKSK
jgi:hypothetical protein